MHNQLGYAGLKSIINYYLLCKFTYVALKITNKKAFEIYDKGTKNMNNLIFPVVLHACIFINYDNIGTRLPKSTALPAALMLLR